MDLKKHMGAMDRTKFQLVHEGTVYVQDCFPELTTVEIRPDTFQYMPCWAILDAGMTVDPHEHSIPEFYVFTNGQGTMRIGDDDFLVRAGLAVNIPADRVHSVHNPPNAAEPLIWISIGLKGAAESWEH